MKSLSTCLALALGCLSAQGESDFLRFENGDQVSGRFLGITTQGDIRMESSELKNPAEFRIDTVRHLVLRGGKAEGSEETLCHLGLTNGDRIPGRVTGIDGTHITLDTKYSGILRVPKEHVSLLASNPLGGRVHYFGPFSADGWSMLRENPAEKSSEGDAKNDKKDDAKSDRWEFSGASWFGKSGSDSSGNANSVALARTEGMTDRSVLRFRMDWKDRIAMSIAFHADFAAEPAAPKDKDDDQNLRRQHGPLPAIFGNCYVLQIYSSHMMLYRSSWDPETGAKFDRVQMNSNYVRLGEDRKTLVEIRSNRTNGHISLFLNDEFVAQWSEPAGNADEDSEGFAGKGNGFGFLSQTGGGAVRISEIMVSEWNGMPDSARSMELDDKDAILMTNGTDRFAGKILSMGEDNSIRFESRHGDMTVPLDEIAEIRFARGQRAETDQNSKSGPVIHLGPIGRITAKSLTGDSELLKLQHAIMGPVDLHTDPVIMIEYKSGTRIGDDWDVDL
jgi:hypothetical protein